MFHITESAVYPEDTWFPSYTVHRRHGDSVPCCLEPSFYQYIFITSEQSLRSYETKAEEAFSVYGGETLGRLTTVYQLYLFLSVR
jgi:hypothetical protein